MKRFQECNKLEKLWRYRWYILIPFKWLWFTYLKGFKVYHDEMIDGQLEDTNNFDVMSGKNLWSLLIGDVQFKMKWYLTNEEVMEKLKKYKDDRKQ
jgi:hypothetical protein